MAPEGELKLTTRTGIHGSWCSNDWESAWPIEAPTPTISFQARPTTTGVSAITNDQ